MRTYAGVYVDYEESLVIYKDEFDKTWRVYETVSSNNVEEIVAALNASQ